MTQSAYTIRIDSDTKNQFDALCEDFGMSATAAFIIFIRSVIRNRRIPFNIEATSREQLLRKGKNAFEEMRTSVRRNGIPEMTLDGINELIHETRKHKI